MPVLALAALAGPAHSFQHMPEAVVRRDGYPDLEVDLCAIGDGRIVIGEAKISDRLEPTKREEARRCAALKGLIDELSADEFVMATTGTAWDRRTETLVNEKIAPAAKVTCAYQPALTSSAAAAVPGRSPSILLGLRSSPLPSKRRIR
ncbi:hypothetical protein [Streptomyces griseoaurantiacus]|uniref:hypothetical protein n=1 Tax=Streptomyces griseoaurantiacus TaxID=68213 RepID=UPI00177FED80|nr:hypothetical protein GCM10018782_10700 [Streptomyces griseoaurantiacus]